MPLAVSAQEQTQEVLSAGPVTVERSGGDTFHYLDELGTAKYFTFSADVTLENSDDDQESAALICGGFKANVHGQNANAPIRIWRDDIDPAGGIVSQAGVDLSQTFNLSVTVSPNGVVSYSVNGAEQCVWQVPENYEGGNFGLMTFDSRATFANITLTKYAEATPEVPDRTTLDALVAECAALKEADYEAEGWTSLQAALQTAAAARTQEQIDAALTALQTAKGALVKKNDRSKLDALVEKAKTYRQDLYTEDSWKALTAALDAAAKATADEEITAALDTLQKAIDDLEEKRNPAAGEDFTNVGGANASVDENGALVLDPLGDHFAMLNSQKTPANDFHLEADVQLLAGTGEGNEGDQMSAALVFGASSKKTPGTKWYGANVDTRRKDNADFFRVFGAGRDILSGGEVKDVDITKPIHLAIDVKADGSFVYTFGNAGALHNAAGKIDGWEGGYVGVLTFNAKAAFSNIAFLDRTEEKQDEILDNSDENWDTNLGDSTVKGGEWAAQEGGLVSNATGKGDTFLISKMEGKNFIYETDLSYKSDGGAAGLLFRYSQTENGKEGYAVNVDAGSHKAKFWRWQADQALQLIDEKDVKPADNYHLKVVCIDGAMQYWVNGVLIANIGDYTMQPGDKGQSTILTQGYYGLLNWNAEAVFQNTRFTTLDEKNTPAVTDVTVGSHDGTVDKKAQFFAESPTWIQYVKNDAKTVFLTAEKAEGSTVSFEKDGVEYKEGKDIPVSEGVNWITMTVSNGKAERTYRLDIHKFADDSTYYNEAYRGQYHYSVKEGWANDPNGLVYYNGKYHMFYQFYDDTKWGPMHWMHATSTDLVHWTDEPVAFYPDMNGTMFSGCIAVDETNKSGLFSTEKGGLVAFITTNGNGQRIKLAYSEDEGKTWKKVDKIAADWTDDPLGTDAFRDPKVFQWEGKWFMVVAGGPLRIYSSDNMVDWKCESTYPNLHTECPDLYPQEVDGQVKWILSRGGRYYKVGDLKEVEGKWTFVPDDYYKDKDGVMNFGRDSYAAMTYYVSSFGTAAKPSIPDIVELNWMNTWDDYCNQVGDAVNQKFNGTFNLHLKVGLKEINGVYCLTQTPVEAYEELRDEGKNYSETIGPDNTLLKDFQGTSYEIVSRFMPSAGTEKVGFKVRTGSNGDETLVIYDVKNDTLTLDRSKSGRQITGKFSETNSQALGDLKQTSRVTRNADGSIDLHIFVDASSVEVFSNDYTVAGANQIFPNPTSRGAAVVVEGEPCKADIQVYNLKSAWNQKADAKVTLQTLDPAEQTIYTGKSKQLNAYILPVDQPQNIVWASDNEEVAAVDDKGNVTAGKAGTAKITAAMKDDPSKALTFTITVKEDNFNTNISDWNQSGEWPIENDEMTNVDNCQNHFTVSKDIYEGDWTLDTDVKYKKGMVNLFFASNASPSDNGAYGLQLKGDGNLRLFRFAMDNVDDVHKDVDKPLNDGEYHHYTIAKKGKTVTVSVDGQQVMEHDYDSPEAHYDKGRVGIGLWDGEVAVKNFIVTPAEKPENPVNKEELKNKTAEARKILEAPEGYTETTVKALADAHQKAVEVLENPDAKQEAVDNALSGLQAALDALEKKPEAPVVTVDKTKLNAAIAAAEKLAEADYTEDSWKSLATALKDAKAAAADDKAAQEDVDKAEAALNKAISGLKTKPMVSVNKAGLAASISQASARKEADYTAESWKPFAQALKKAQDVMADKAATADDVQKAMDALNKAASALKAKPADPAVKVNKDKLKEQLDAAAKLTESQYTADSWKAFRTALEQAKKVHEDPKASQADVDKAKDALKEAMDRLVKKAGTPSNGGTTNTPGKTPTPAGKNPTAVITGAAGLIVAAGASLAAMIGLKRRKK